MKLNAIAHRLITRPTIEPLDIRTVKKHLNVQHDRDDTLISIYMIAARQEAEKLTGKKFITQTWEFDFPCFPFNVGVFMGSGYEDYSNGGYGYQSHGNSLEVPVKPAQAVDFIKYIDPQGNLQTFGTFSGSPLTPEEYGLIRDNNNPRVALKVNQVWPITAQVDNAVTLRVIAGLGDSGADVPALWILGMMLLVGHFYENRETVVVDDSRVQAIEIPLGVRDLLAVPKVG